MNILGRRQVDNQNFEVIYSRQFRTKIQDSILGDDARARLNLPAAGAKVTLRRWEVLRLELPSIGV